MSYYGIPGLVYSDVYGWQSSDYNKGDDMALGKDIRFDLDYDYELIDGWVCPKKKDIFKGNPYAAVEYDHTKKIEEMIAEELAKIDVNVGQMWIKSCSFDNHSIVGPRTMEVTLVVTLPEPADHIDIQLEPIEKIEDSNIIDAEFEEIKQEVSSGAINRIRDAISAIEEEIGIHPDLHSKAVEEIKAQEDERIFGKLNALAGGGVTCKTCNDFNEFCDEPNQSDGTHLCYKCKKGY